LGWGGVAPGSKLSKEDLAAIARGEALQSLNFEDVRALKFGLDRLIAVKGATGNACEYAAAINVLLYDHFVAARS
jgi:hypothetical protein